jgi:hypothetical protein
MRETLTITLTEHINGYSLVAVDFAQSGKLLDAVYETREEAYLALGRFVDEEIERSEISKMEAI